LTIEKKNGANWTEITNWANGLEYNTKSTAITIRLMKDGAKWDEETIEFVHDGAPGDPATVTPDALYENWPKKDGEYEKGLVVLKPDEEGTKYYGLNADAIRAGVFKIAEDVNTDADKCKFYADCEKGTNVYIAGWAVNNNSITKGELGRDGFHMFSANSSDNSNSGAYFGAPTSKSWMLGIGSNFGATNAGVLYCKNIHVTGGTFNIGDNFEVTDQGQLSATSATLKNGVFFESNSGTSFSLSAFEREAKPEDVTVNFDWTTTNDIYDYTLSWENSSISIGYVFDKDLVCTLPFRIAKK
jgi:hypothetical protein